MTRARVGAWCGLGCLQFFVCEQLSRLGWPGHYSLRLCYISELGESSLCAAHALMNLSFGIQAILIASAGLLLPQAALGRPARALLVVSALGLASVATHPADHAPTPHLAGAALHFLGGSLGMLFAAKTRSATGAFQVALSFGAAALIGDLLLVLPLQQVNAFLGVGIVERLAAYPLPLWLAWTGYRTLRERPGAL